MDKLRIGTKGIVTSGPSKGWYVLIKADDVVPDEEQSYLLFISRDIDFHGGSNRGVYNSWCQNLGDVIRQLEVYGAIENQRVFIEWLE